MFLRVGSAREGIIILERRPVIGIARVEILFLMYIDPDHVCQTVATAFLIAVAPEAGTFRSCPSKVRAPLRAAIAF